jgi:hypothetical protein
MKPFRLLPLNEQQPKALDELYRTRAQMVFLSAEQKMTVPQIAAIVRESEPTVLRWLKLETTRDNLKLGKVFY